MAFNRCSALCTTHGQQCPNGGRILHEGKWYCKKHDPHGGTMTRRTLQRAAPDLLAALKAYPGPLVCDTQLAAWESQARAAIRKADGES